MPISRGACRDFLEDFSSFVDGRLDARRRSRFVAHLDCCEACLRHLRAYRKGVDAFREVESREEPVWGMYDRVLERLVEERVRARETDSVVVASGGSRSTLEAVGVGLVMVVLALFLVVPYAGRTGPTEHGSEGGMTATAGSAPTSWASVIPSALPRSGIGQGATDRLRSTAAPSRSRRMRSDIRLAIDELPEVPRHQVRIARLDRMGNSVRASTLAGWPPRRPPIVIDRAATVYPAAWVAEAALRIP